MLLGLDASRLAGTRTGVGRYLEYLLACWSTQEGPFEHVELFTRAPIEGVPEGGRYRVRVIPSRAAGAWWQTTKLRPKAAAVDVLFAPYTIPPGYSGRSVVSNLGILEGPNRMPGLRARARSWHFAYSARQADAVIANSETTKAGLVEHFGVEADKVTVIWPGADRAFRPLAAGEEKLGATVRRILGDRAPFVLYVGKLSLRRNVPALLEAFAKLASERPELRLLFVGPNTESIPLEPIVARFGLNGAVRHIEYLNQDDLAALYRGAEVFALPTMQEGFSFTILEAMASGCPVLTVDHSSLRESGLDQAAVVAPDARASTLSEAMSRLMHDDGLRTELAERGARLASGFTWDKTARRTMDVLSEVAQR